MDKSAYVEDIMSELIKLGLDFNQMEALSGDLADFLERADADGSLPGLIKESMDKLANPAAAAAAAPSTWIGLSRLVPAGLAAFLASRAGKSFDTVVGAGANIAKGGLGLAGAAAVPLGIAALGLPYLAGRFGGELAADTLYNSESDAERKYIQDREILAALRESTRQVKQRAGIDQDTSVDSQTDFS
jgi:hypothetical protein